MTLPAALNRRHRSRTGLDPDPSGGISYLNNRYHDPALGSFLSVDPLVQKTGDPYTYGAVNPTTELRTAHIEGDDVFNELARGLDSALSTVGDVAEDVADLSAVVAGGCLVFAGTDKENIGPGVACAAAAGSVGLAAEASAATVELFETSRLSDCTMAGAAHTVLVPSGLLGDYGTSLAMEFTKVAFGGALGMACND